MTDPYPDTPGPETPIPEGGHHQGRSRYGFWGTLVGLPKLEHRFKEILMARLDPIDTALGNISTQLTQLSTQIADLTAGSVTDAEIAALAAKAQGIADAVDAAIEPDAGEGEPPVEEPPTEPPTP